MPTAGIAADMLECDIEAMEDECLFFDSERENVAWPVTNLVPVSPAKGPKSLLTCRRQIFAYLSGGLRVLRKVLFPVPSAGIRL
jgi:hypothetical protein